MFYLSLVQKPLPYYTCADIDPTLSQVKQCYKTLKIKINASILIGLQFSAFSNSLLKRGSGLIPDSLAYN